MAIYAIGDLQGCLHSYLELLDKLALGSDDKIWLTGDLVNRGPSSLETLRFIKTQGDRVITVLGNHDLHLLALDAGLHAQKPNPTLQPILRAEDKHELLTWLRERPLFHQDDNIGWALAHAGIHPAWSVSTAAGLAREAEAAIRPLDNNSFMHEMYGNHPDAWQGSLIGHERIRFIVNAFTRMRFCYPDGRLDFVHKGPVGDQGKDLVPWFDIPRMEPLTHRIVFGHWSALGRSGTRQCLGIDTGCLWGGRLTAIRLDDGSNREISVQCPRHEKVHG